MTGFARVDGADRAASWAWEARSVNGRGLDIRVRLPQSAALAGEPWELLARDAVKTHLARGTVNISLQMRLGQSEPVSRINRTRLRAYAAEAARLARWGLAQPASADALLTLRGVVETSGDGDATTLDDATRAAMKADLQQLAHNMALSCQREGAVLAQALLDLLEQLQSLHGEAKAQSADIPQRVQSRLAARLAELTGEHVSEDRLAQEAALLAVKADVREELDRFGAHIATAHELLAAGGAIGRRLDFLAQELMREANTLCAKSADMALTRSGLALKAVIEQFREQVQNVA